MTVVRDESGTPIDTYRNYTGAGSKPKPAAAAVSQYGYGLQGRFKPDDINQYVNPAPDPRLNSILQKTGSPLRMGILQQTDDMVAAPQKHPYACRFMFNPTTISVGYQTSEEAYPASSLTAEQLSAVQLGPGQTGISFNLLFDRTYEVAYGKYGDPLHELGVYRDVAALESVVGARFNFATAADQVIQSMQLVPCYFIFGGGGGATGLSFIGAITGMTVTYSTFSERMVPQRCGVELQVQQVLGGDINKLRGAGGTLLRRRDEEFARSQSRGMGRPTV